MNKFIKIKNLPHYVKVINALQKNNIKIAKFKKDTKCFAIVNDIAVAYKSTKKIPKVFDEADYEEIYLHSNGMFSNKKPMKTKKAYTLEDLEILLKKYFTIINAKDAVITFKTFMESDKKHKVLTVMDTTGVLPRVHTATKAKTVNDMIYKTYIHYEQKIHDCSEKKYDTPRKPEPNSNSKVDFHKPLSQQNLKKTQLKEALKVQAKEFAEKNAIDYNNNPIQLLNVISKSNGFEDYQGALESCK